MSRIEISARIEDNAPFVQRERRLQQLVTAYIIAGLLFMLLPGTFLGVWNLISISAQHTVDTLSPAWLQAHGHAQIFGWLGTFILGIGFYSLSKMANLPSFAVSRGWLSFGLWTAGVSLRWTANITAWEWRLLLPLSAAFELAGFLLFFLTVVRHRPAPATGPPRKKDAWMIVVIGSTIAFLATLLVNLGAAVYVSIYSDSPAVPFVFDQRLLVLPTWGFLVPTVWGFNARWLPTFLGLRAPTARPLYAAMLTAWAGVVMMLYGYVLYSTMFLPVAAVLAIYALGIFERPVQPAKLNGVHHSFPIFIRIAYIFADGVTVVGRRCPNGPGGRSLGGLAARPDRRFSGYHGLLHRPQDSPGILRRADSLQPEADVSFTGLAEHRLPVARLFGDRSL
jgi:hypothetical protein